jgi:predicted DNA-binding protein
MPMPKPKRKLKTSIYLSSEQQEALKKISKHTRIPMAELLREAVDNVIKAHRKNLKK